MEPNVRIIRPGESSPPSLKGLEEISRFLDSRFVIPGTKIRFGFDPLLSLFPVFGDLFTFLISAMLIYKMKQHGASREVVIKMMLNSTLDAVIGAVPLIGTVFDVFYRVRGGDKEPAGTGLGLSICRGLIEAHGGQIEALPGPGGRGTTIAFWLPMHPLPAIADGGDEDEREPEGGGAQP